MPTPKWSESQVKTLEQGYNPDYSNESVEMLMDTLDKNKRQVIGKLVSMKLYVAPEKPTKIPKDDGPTKGEILTSIINAGFDVTGFENATKPALTRLKVYVEGQREQE